MKLITHENWDFPGGPVVKTLCFTSGDMGLIPGWELKSRVPHGVAKKTTTTKNHT